MNFRVRWNATILTNTSQIIAGHCCTFRASTIKWSRNIVAMMTTATIIGGTFVDIYKEYLSLGHSHNANQSECFWFKWPMASNSQIMNPTHTFNCFGISPFAMEANFRSWFFHPNIICASDPERLKNLAKMVCVLKILPRLENCLMLKLLATY